MAERKVTSLASRIRRVTIPISGFTCAGSEALAVERALMRVPGVSRAYVNGWTEMAYVEFDSDRAELDHLARAIERGGLRAGPPSPVADRRTRWDETNDDTRSSS
jgi:cation transport ATPase